MTMVGARFGALVVALVAFLSSLVAAQNSTTVPASTWYFAKTETQFSVNIPENSSDVFMYFASPAFSWVGVGFGKSMENSLMIVMYADNSGNNVTLSPRFGSKDVEPSYAPSVKLDILPGTTVTSDDMFVLHAVCRDCRVWPHGFLDVKSKAQPMFYAFGPGNVIQSDSPSASLRRHARYGFFTMDMTAAIGQGGVPANSSSLAGVTMVGEIVHDHDRATMAHTIMGCMALFVIWPLNVLVAGFLKNIRLHIGVSVIIVAFLIISFSLGISVSYQFNRSKTFSSPHQIFAFLSLLPILLMAILPIPSVSKLHSMLPRLHTPLVTLTFSLLVLTGGLGLSLSSQTKPIILAYSAMSFLVFVFTATPSTCIRKRGSAFARANKRRDDERVEMLKLENGCRALPPAQYTPQASREFGAGVMPGPQYMLNMHPGVPVNRW